MEKQIFIYQIVFKFFSPLILETERLIVTGESTDVVEDLLSYASELANFALGQYKKENQYSFILESFSYQPKQIVENGTQEKT